MNKRILGMFYIVSLLTINGLVANDYPKTMKDLHHLAFDYFESEKFNELEVLGEELRSKDERFDDGQVMLREFYKGIIGNRKTESEWKIAFDRLEQWEKLYPDSRSYPTARIWMGTAYAWSARGSGWASTVSEAQSNEFSNRLEVTHKFYLATSRYARECPHFYPAVMQLALGQGWTKESFQKLLERYPASDWNLQNFVFYASLANDQETVNSLIDKIKDPNLEVWRKKDYFEKVKEKSKQNK